MSTESTKSREGETEKPMSELRKSVEVSELYEGTEKEARATYRSQTPTKPRPNCHEAPSGSTTSGSGSRSRRAKFGRATTK